MVRKDVVKALTANLGHSFSTDLGIDLTTGDAGEVFKWFLASILFGARINETIVMNTYEEFEVRGVQTPKTIIDMGWDGLVQILDAGGYVRYDFKTATKLLEVVGTLLHDYDGEIRNVHRVASDPRDLERRVMALGKGIGTVTTGIFLRELRGIWEKADPPPQELASTAAWNLGFTDVIDKSEVGRNQVLNDLKFTWDQAGIRGKTFIDFESALVRLGKNNCRRQRCEKCFMKQHCRFPKSLT